MVKRIIIGKQKKNFTKVEDVEIIKILKNPDQKSFLKFQNIFKKRVNYLIQKYSFMGSDIDIKVLEIIEDLYMELSDNLKIPNNVGIFTYINNQIEWRLKDYLKKQKERTISLGNSNYENTTDNIELDETGKYGGLHSIKESDDYLKEINKKTTYKDIKLDSEQVEDFSILFKLLFSFLENFKVIDNFQKEILELKIIEGKKHKEIAKLLSATEGIIKKQYLRAKELTILFFSKNNLITLESYVNNYFKLDEICSFLSMNNIIESTKTQKYIKINFKDREILDKDHSFFKWLLSDLSDFTKLLLIKYAEKKIIEGNNILRGIFADSGELLEYIPMQELGFNNVRTVRDLNILDLVKAINEILRNIEYFEGVIYKNK